MAGGKGIKHATLLIGM